MDLTKLFETQATLDEHIMQEHPEIRGQDNLDWKILALQVELAECANEWRGFKKWSKDQEPRTEIFVECKLCLGSGDANYEMIQEAAEGIGGHEYIDCESCEGSGSDGPKNPLLEEYVDCLHFILSIGLEEVINPKMTWDEIDNCIEDVTRQFAEVFEAVVELGKSCRMHCGFSETDWVELFENFYILGKKLGFTWEQIEAAYFEKNQINHARQANGY